MGQQVPRSFHYEETKEEDIRIVAAASGIDAGGIGKAEGFTGIFEGCIMDSAIQLQQKVSETWELHHEC